MTSRIDILGGCDRASLYVALQEGIDVILHTHTNPKEEPKTIRVCIHMLRIIDDERREWNIEGHVVWCEWDRRVKGRTFTGYYQLSQGRTGYLDLGS